MGDFPNHQVFSKDIAETIGLEEAIIFETIKSQETKRISKEDPEKGDLLKRAAQVQKDADEYYDPLTQKKR